LVAAAPITRSATSASKGVLRETAACLRLNPVRSSRFGVTRWAPRHGCACRRRLAASRRRFYWTLIAAATLLIPAWSGEGSSILCD
jgi:hypothetical protein